MARTRSGWGKGIVGTMLMAWLLVWAAWTGCQRDPQPAAAPAQTQGAAAELVSDDRIIFGGIPRARQAEVTFTVLKNSAYMVGYSEERKDPLWSAYRVIRKEDPFILDRPKGDFVTDLRTRARVAHHDFTGSGYDRGHMSPNSAIARCFGAQAQEETFLLSNICPQAPSLNQKVWEKLEKEELVYAERYGEVWVMDGPVFGDLSGSETRKLRSGIAVPRGFYKILVEDHAGRPRAFAVVMPQGVKGTEAPGQFVVSIKEIEAETGLEFLWKLDAKTREELEGKAAEPW